MPFTSGLEPNPHKKTTISIRNRSADSIIVDNIYINGDDNDTDIQIESQKSKKETIELCDVWNSGERYTIKVVTTKGEMDEKVVSAK